LQAERKTLNTGAMLQAGASRGKNAEYAVATGLNYAFFGACQ